MAITLYKQKTVNKNEKKKVQKNFLKKKIQKKIGGDFFFFKMMKFGLKKNHKIAGITNCKITKCGDPL